MGCRVPVAPTVRVSNFSVREKGGNLCCSPEQEIPASLREDERLYHRRWVEAPEMGMGKMKGNVMKQRGRNERGERERGRVERELWVFYNWSTLLICRRTQENVRERYGN